MPVIIRPCAFKRTNLAQFQAVNDPSQPLSKMQKYKREEVWTKIAELVEAVMNADNELLLTLGLSTHVEPRKTKEAYINEGLLHHKAERYTVFLIMMTLPALLVSILPISPSVLSNC